jgi:hypothetical protein
MARNYQRILIMNKQTMKRAAFIAIASALALGAATPTSAAPVFSSTRALNNAVQTDVTDVRYYRHYRGRHYHNDGAAVALGVLGVAGAVAGAAAYGYAPGYYGEPGYYRQGYYGTPGYYRHDYGQDYYGGNQTPY